MAVQRKKKYRAAADRLAAYGFDDRLIPGGLTAEAIYGLDLNSRRVLAMASAQVFRAKFFIDVMGFYMDDEILDALSPSEDYKPVTHELFLRMYKESTRWRNRPGGRC